ncbi:MAG TPA: hypothetical protein V6C64_06665, partial [Microcoleaceae cyanobacterium]
SNNGNQTLTNVVVTDPLTGVNQTIASLAPGASQNILASYTITQADIDNNGGGDGDIDNKATADSDQTGPVDDSTETPLAKTPGLTIAKAATIPGDADGKVDSPSDDILYTVTVNNTGNQTLTNVVVTDPLAVTATNPTGQIGVIASLAPGASKQFQFTYDVTQAIIDSNGGGDGDIDNIATADSDQTDPKSATALVPLVYNPNFDITKTVTSVTGGTADVAGDIINYQIAVANTGNVSLTGVIVSDKVESYATTKATYVSGDSTTTGTVGVLDVGETWLYSASYTLTATDLSNKGGGDSKLDNVATADTDQTNPKSASASVPLVYNTDVAQIAPTNTTPQQYINGTAVDFDQYYASQGGAIQYGVNREKINQTNPGVLYYYTGLSNSIKGVDANSDGKADSITVFIDQSNNGPNVDNQSGNSEWNFGATLNDVKLYKVIDNDHDGRIDAGDTPVQVQLKASDVKFADNKGDVTVTFTPDAVGSLYIIGVKYDTSTVVGLTPGATRPTVNYTFNTDVGANGTIDETDLKGITLKYKAALTLDGTATSGGAVLTQDELDPVINAAIDYWAAQGVNSASLDKLRHTDVLIGDLGGTLLGSSDNFQVQIDDDADGYGWSTSIKQVTPGKVDLLSAVTHEFGHILGLEHDVMGETLGVGERHLPLADENLEPLKQQYASVFELQPQA